jgi:hypothetical protein
MKNLLFILLILSYRALAQQEIPTTNPTQTSKESFRIVNVSVDTTKIVTVLVELTGNIQPTQDDFAVTDDIGNKVDIFNFEKQGEETGTLSTRLVYFLIDASNYTDGMPLKNFKSAVKETLGLLTANDLVNVGYFGDEAGLVQLDREFSGNFAGLDTDIENRITASLDSGATSDAFKAMYDAIDRLKKTDKEGQKVLIVVSGGIKSGASEYSADDVIAYAKKNNVTIHTVSYRTGKEGYSFDTYRIISNKTDGEARETKSSTEIKNALGDFLENRATTNIDNGTPQYVLKFGTSYADGLEHSFKITYAETEQIGRYIAPGASSGGNGIFNNYTILIVIIVGLLGGVGYWQWNEMRLRRLEQEEEEAMMEEQRQDELERREREKQSLLQDMQEKNIRLQEQLRMKEQELAQKAQEIMPTPTVIPSQKFDLKSTIISGGGGAPVLLVSAGVFQQNFRLNKPTMTIGRGAINDIVIPEQTVSTKHATITIENGSFFLNDLGSTNGTFVNGSRIDKKLLKAGDIIKFGAANCRFEI